MLIEPPPNRHNRMSAGTRRGFQPSPTFWPTSIRICGPGHSARTILLDPISEAAMVTEDRCRKPGLLAGGMLEEQVDGGVLGGLVEA